jgi:hypothetical protein
MKIYEVECRAVITLVEQDIARAALEGAAFIREHPDLIYVRAVRQRDFNTSGKRSVTSMRDESYESEIQRD